MSAIFVEKRQACEKMKKRQHKSWDSSLTSKDMVNEHTWLNQNTLFFSC
jgi:hypothetical protein